MRVSLDLCRQLDLNFVLRRFLCLKTFYTSTQNSGPVAEKDLSLENYDLDV